jgi:NAD-dependent dihydropyrimidine dehydrogenase PreA subunit
MRKAAGILLLMMVAFSTLAAAPDSSDIWDKCRSCIYVTGEAPSLLSIVAKMLGVVAVIVLAAGYGWKTSRRKIYLLAGGLACCLVIGSYIYSIAAFRQPGNPSALCPIVDSCPAEKFMPVGAEFEDADAPSSSEFSSTLDEFSPAEKAVAEAPSSNRLLYQTLALLLLSAAIGMTLKYALVRRLRPFVLLASLVFLGFISGACPCVIMSFQQVILFVLGLPVHWVAMLWFLGLVLTTYFFGKTWCGWLCHLGALQELIFRRQGRKYLASERSQRTIKYVQIALLVVLVAQLIITRSIEFVKYDPFKVAFNLFSANATGYVLLVLLLLFSVLVYRPFCRIFCPVGLVLGWVSRLPRARKLKVDNASCSGCQRCVQQCRQQSIRCTSTAAAINGEDCILCGDCLSGCNKNAIKFKI